MLLRSLSRPLAPSLAFSFFLVACSASFLAACSAGLQGPPGNDAGLLDVQIPDAQRSDSQSLDGHLVDAGPSRPVDRGLTIFHASSSAKPGDAISLQGNFGMGARAFLQVSTSEAVISLPILAQQPAHILTKIPGDVAFDLYRIWIEKEDAGVRRLGPDIFVNRAVGMHLDSPEITPSGNLRIFGRNLQLEAGRSTVGFFTLDGAHVGDGQVDVAESDAYSLHLQAPAGLQPGMRYAIRVNNGLGGASGETEVSENVLAIASGEDYFDLNVPWAARFDFYRNVYNVKTDPRLTIRAVGDGQTNDQPAIQNAITQAAADGGGIVYLPAGTYKMTYQFFEYIQMRSRVVIQGAGKNQTILKFGYDLGEPHMGVLWPDNADVAGIADLTLENVDNTGNANAGNMRGGRSRYVFMQRINFKLNRGDWLDLKECDGLLIANSEFSQGVDANSNYHGPFQLNDSIHFAMVRNTITYAVDGINLNFARSGVFENNQVFRDGSARYPTSLVNHVLILNFAENVAVLNNLFRVVNGPAQNSNDGETIIAEGGGPARLDEDAGSVTAATSTTLSDSNKAWAPAMRRPVVALVSGNGMGQWRWIESRTSNTLTLDRAWEIVPEAGSHYAIFDWGSRNWLVQGNTMEGNRRGITLYHNGTTEVAMVNNTLLNSGSIDLTPLQVDSEAHQIFIPMYDNQIVGNSVSNTDGSNGVFIGVHTVQHVQPNVFGTSVIGLEVRGNNLVAGIPNIPAIVDAPFPEGYLNYVEFHPLNTSFGDEFPAVLGSIFEGNTATNCENALYLNSGSYNTYVCETQLVNSSNAIRDEQLPQNSHASVNTVLCGN